MSDWPASPLPAALALSPFSQESLGPFMGFVTASLANATSAAWPAANRALYYPFRIGKSVLFLTAFAMHGATLSGNWDMGIFQWASGKKVWSLGSRAQSSGTINTVEAISINAGAGVRLEPGAYYLGLAMDNGTGTFFRQAPSAQTLGGVGVAQQAAAFPLPDPITPATNATGYVPLFGVGRKSVL